MFWFSSQRSLYLFSGLSLWKIIDSKYKHVSCGCQKLIAQRTSVNIQQLSLRWTFLTFYEKHFLNCSLIQSQSVDLLLHERSQEVKKKNQSFKHFAQWILTNISSIWVFTHFSTENYSSGPSNEHYVCVKLLHYIMHPVEKEVINLLHSSLLININWKWIGCSTSSKYLEEWCVWSQHHHLTPVLSLLNLENSDEECLHVAQLAQRLVLS